MLRLNFFKDKALSATTLNSNTTNVKVKRRIVILLIVNFLYSNTTNVKVKLSGYPVSRFLLYYSNTTNVKVKQLSQSFIHGCSNIQIQPMLRLNLRDEVGGQAVNYSNTTNVKVKRNLLGSCWQLQIYSNTTNVKVKLMDCQYNKITW